MRPRNKTRADLILICSLLLITGALFLFRNAGKHAGETVAVYRNGEKIASCSLYDDKELILEDESGGTNTLKISDGAANMIDANCPDHICVYMPEIRQVGETIICLPHRLEIRIEGSDKPEVDLP